MAYTVHSSRRGILSVSGHSCFPLQNRVSFALFMQSLHWGIPYSLNILKKIHILKINSEHNTVKVDTEPGATPERIVDVSSFR